MYRTIIFNLSRRTSHEVNAKLDQVTWSKGRSVELSFYINLSDPGISLDVIKPSNIVLFEHQYSIPWAGVLWFPQEWGEEEATIVAKSPEHYLQGRLCDYQITETDTVEQGIFKMLAAADQVYPLPFIIDEENIKSAGEGGRSTKWEKDQYIFDVLNDQADKSGTTWWFEVSKQEFSHPLFEFFWGQRGSLVGADIEVGQGGNASWVDKGLVYSGDLVSSWRFIEEEGDASSAVRVYTDDEMLAKYGLWQGVARVSQVSSEAGMNVEELAAMAEGQLTRGFHLKAPPSSMTKTLRPGSIHTLSASNMGFFENAKRTLRTKVEIDTFSFSADDGMFEIVAFEYVDRNTAGVNVV